MGLLDYASEAADWLPIVSNVKGAIEGDKTQAVLGSGAKVLDLAKDAVKTDPNTTAQNQAKTDIDTFRSNLPQPTSQPTPQIGQADKAKAAVDSAQAAYDRAIADLQAAQARGITDPGEGAQLGGKVTAAKAALDQANAAYRTAVATDPTGGHSTYVGNPATYTAQTYSPTGYTASGYTAQGYAAPQVATAPLISAGTVTPGTITAQQTSAPGAIDAPVIGNPGSISAGTVTAERIGMPTQQAAGRDVTATNIDRIMLDKSMSGESRDMFLRALKMAEDQANGTAPSAAQALLQKAIDQNARQQLGIAATLQGRSPGAALRTGQQGLMAANAASAADMAALRAQEQTEGRKVFASAAQGLNANDISQAQSQLQADVDISKSNADNLLRAAMSNQTKDVNTSIANMNAQIDVAKANQQAALEAGKANVANALQASIETMRNQIAVATTNANNALTAKIETIKNQIQVETANADRAERAGEANLAAQTQANIANLNAELEAAKANQSTIMNTNKTNAELLQNASQFNASATNPANQFNTGEQNKAAADFATATNNAGQFNAGQTNDASKFNATAQNDTAKFNADMARAIAAINIDANLKGQEIDRLRQQGYTDTQIRLMLASAGISMDIEKQKNIADANANQIIWGTAANVGSSLATGGIPVGGNRTTPTQYGPNGSPIIY